jgi:hypothetical protein
MQPSACDTARDNAHATIGVCGAPCNASGNGRQQMQEQHGQIAHR